MEAAVGNKIELLKFAMATRQLNGNFSYNVDAKMTEFHPADGKPRATRDANGRAVKATFSCEGNDLWSTFVDDETGAILDAHYTVLNDDEIELRTNKKSRTGIYTRLS